MHSLDSNYLCGEFYVNEAELQGDSYAEGAAVTYSGYPATVVQEKDSDGDIKIQSSAGLLAITDVLPKTGITSIRYCLMELACVMRSL